jgi:KaiC/GvpD/RAD55 family RecA-like ATPase
MAQTGHPTTAEEEGLRRTRFTNLGFEGLEVLLGGGLPESAVYLLAGAPGTHYTTFAQQAIHNHLLQNGKAVYYSPDFPSSDIQEDMGLYGWKVRRYVDDESLIFTRPLPPPLQKIAEAMPENPMEEVVSLGSTMAGLKNNFIDKLKEERWSVLSLSYLMTVYPFQEIADLVLFWVNAAHRHAGVHFILLPQGAHEEKQVALVENLVDGVLSFKFVQGFLQMEGEVEVKKVRRLRLKAKVFRYSVQANGIVIENAKRIV